jgi:hypothetical protein
MAVLRPGRTRYPLYRRLGGPQGRSGRVRKTSPQPGFHPRTVQPVASRYTELSQLPVAVCTDIFDLSLSMRCYMSATNGVDVRPPSCSVSYCQRINRKKADVYNGRCAVLFRSPYKRRLCHRRLSGSCAVRL